MRTSRGARGWRAQAGRKRRTWVSALVGGLAATIAAITPAVSHVRPASAATSTSSCTEDGVTWSVEFSTTTSIYGVVLSAQDLSRTEGGVTSDATSQQWELRWDVLSHVFPPASSTMPPSYHSVRGELTPTGIGRPIPNYQSPRLVTPDGVCSIYLAPFSNLGGVAATPTVAVLGDELVHQLNDSATNQSALQGHVEARLTGLGIRSEIEGHTGGRLSPATGATGIDGSTTHLLDEYRGLLEHDIDGAVVALGVNDAVYIASGASPAQMIARRDEVYAGASAALTEIASRTGCVAVVTAPQNATTLDPDYAWAAGQVNNLVRYLVGLGSTTDVGEVIDFGALAAGHRPTDPEPWFGPDGVHLTGAGLDAYAAALTRGAQRCADGVVLWGAPGTLDDPAVAGRDVLPSGHAFARRTVDAWDFGPSKAPHFSTITDDGTLFFMTGGTGGNVYAANGEGMQLAAFHPDEGSFATIPIKTDRNVELPQASCPNDGFALARWDWCDSDPNVEGEDFTMGGWIGDVDTLGAGDAVAFTGYQAYLGQDSVTEGLFPAFGVVSRGANGEWQVVEGPDANADGLPDWRNAWSPRELADATVAAADPADPTAVANAQALVEALCPTSATDVNGLPVRDCGLWVNEMAVLPESNDVAIAHYGPGKVSVIDVGDPDAAGRMTARIAAVYDLPDIHDPAFPSDPAKMVTPAPREVQADPSSTLGDERFALQNDFAPGLIEFSYDATATDPAARLHPVSAPVISGELYTPENDPNTAEDESAIDRFVPYGQFLYDHAGNLWIPTSGGRHAHGVKVYVKSGGERQTLIDCVDVDAGGQPLPLEAYTATAPDGVRPVWAKACPADFNISTQRIMGPTYGIEEDPATHNIALTDWAHGITTVIDPEGSGTGMTFQVGSFTNPMVRSTMSASTISGPCTKPPPLPAPDSCTSGRSIGEMQGPIDATGRLWLALAQTVPHTLRADASEHHMQPLEQFAYSIDLTRLLGREPVQLATQPGDATFVQAEQTQTRATTRTPGTSAALEVRPTAPIRPCLLRNTVYGPQACTDPVTGIAGGGYALGGEHDANLDGIEPVPPGTTAEYRITVPKGGTYDVTYFASDRGLAGAQNLVLTVNGTAYTTQITSSGAVPYAAMKNHSMGTPITLTEGIHTISVSAPQGGWELDWIRFARV